MPVCSVGRRRSVLLAAGDIAGCAEHYQDEVTAKFVDTLPGTIALLGDVVYQHGTRWQFRNCYHPSWGRLLSRSRPSPGNHEYRTNEAAPYYEYFGSRAGPSGKGYYTYRLGAWRIYSLNSERNLAEQETWLKAHLAANPSKCILAYWHKPLYTSGRVPPTPAVRPLFDAFYRAGAEWCSTDTSTTTSGSRPRTPTATPSREAPVNSWWEPGDPSSRTSSRSRRTASCDTSRGGGCSG